MAKKSQASKRYALALVESISASKKLSLDEALGELSLFTEAVRESFDLKNALLNPAFTRDEREKMVQGIIAHLKLSDTIARFVRILVDSRRIREIEDINETFRALADERRGRVRATVHSAAALSKDTEERLRRALEKTTGRTIELDTHVDPSLIGGIRATVGSMVFDGTIRSELNRLKTQLEQGE
jgi:F-type H+-transporting ATPase subunit delta